MQGTPNGTQKSASERRTHRRLRVAAKRVWALVETPSAPPMRVAVRDISGLGVLVEVPQELLESWPTLRTEVTVNLQLDDTNHIAVAGRVAWMGGRSIAHHRTYRAGLEFAALTQDAQQMLNHWMARLSD